MDQSYEETSKNIAADIYKLDIDNFSDLSPLKAKQEPPDPDVLKYVFELFIDKYDYQKLETYFANTYNYYYDKSYENIKIHPHNDFRNKLINDYNNCIVTGKAHLLCDAAYILSFYDIHANFKTENAVKIRYSRNNGILLCRDLCYLFNHPKKYMKINPNNMTIEFTKEFLDDKNCGEYHKYHNMHLNTQLNPITIKYLKNIY